MVLIPSYNRPSVLLRNLRKMPFLNMPNTLFAVHSDEWWKYTDCRRTAPRAGWIEVKNPSGSVAVMREALRRTALRADNLGHPDIPIQYYVVTDDNATYSEESLDHLVTCARTFPRRPCTVAGMHNTAPHFDRRAIEQTKEEHGGVASYAVVSMMFQCYPRDLYEKYRYPPDAYGLDDRHFYLWAIDQGVREFRVCMDAPFNKARYQEGGQGTVIQRALKNGRAIARLATDFPDLVGAAGTLRIPWQLILGMKAGSIPDRLAGGSMRTESRILSTSRSQLRARVRTSTSSHERSKQS